MHSDDDPILQPHLVKRLKNRKRLIDFGFREEVLEELEDVLSEKRKPDKVGERAVDSMRRRAGEVADPVAKRKVTKSIKKANDNLLDRI